MITRKSSPPRKQRGKPSSALKGGRAAPCHAPSPQDGDGICCSSPLLLPPSPGPSLQAVGSLPGGCSRAGGLVPARSSRWAPHKLRCCS